jgi:cyclase
MQKLTDRVYVETEFSGCNTSFVVTGEGVVLIDTPMIPADAIKWRDEIAKHGPLRYVIDAEPHIDHFAGNYFFEGTVVAHEGTKAAIADTPLEQLKGMLKRTSPDSLSLMDNFSFRLPTVTFTEQLTIHLGGLTFQLIHLPGHSPYQIAIYVPEEKVIFASDNVTGRLPVFRDAIPRVWLNSLKRMQQLQADTVVPGHGGICKYSYIAEMSTRVQTWIDAVSSAIKQGMTAAEAQEKVTVKDGFLEASQDIPMVQQQARDNIGWLYQALKK